MKRSMCVLLISALLLCVNATGPAAARRSPVTDDPVLVGAGDIGACDMAAEATAKLLDTIDGTVFTAGDNAYDDGTPTEFHTCYDPTWGRHKARTRPSPGNHDYHSLGAAPYFAYFGENAGAPGLGYYSYDLGTWHIVSLNSNIDAGPGSTEERWLRADLAAHPAACTLAYWHHPVFSSGGAHGSDPHMQAIWRVLYDFRADVVVNGHDHDYERFAPQNPDGQAEADRGIREFVVGTGGQVLESFGKIRPNSEVHNNDTWGVLKLTLYPTSYDWEFIPVAGKTFRDSGSGSCVEDNVVSLTRQ